MFMNKGRNAYYRPPLRPAEPGKSGRPISLQVNHFQVVRLPQNDIHHYDISIIPEKTPRKLNREIISRMLSTNDPRFGGQRPVYDGQKNMYARAMFPFGLEKITVEVFVPEEGGKDRKFSVTLKWVARVSMAILEQFLGGDKRASLAIDDVQASIQSLDVILRYGPASRYVPVGRSFFTPPMDGGHDLGAGLVVWRGFHMSMRPSMWRMQLNIDVSATAFYKGQEVTDFLIVLMKDKLSIDHPDLSRQLSDAARNLLKKELKGLRIEASHCTPKRKYRVIDVPARSARMLCFPIQRTEGGPEEEVSVASYFEERHRRPLRYPNLPCLQVGKKERHTFLPLEVCRLAVGQRCPKKLTDTQTSAMIKKTASRAPDRAAETMRLVRQAHINEDPSIRDFQIEISEEMTRLKGRVLPAPIIRHGVEGRQQTAEPRDGSWEIRGKKMHSGKEINKWCILNFDRRVNHDSLRHFFHQLGTSCTVNGMRLSPEPVNVRACYRAPDIEPTMRAWVDQHHVQMIFAIMQGRSNFYGEVKRVGDTILGVPTQCLQTKNILRPQTQTLTNICLKMNAKLGGVNFVVDKSVRSDFFREPVIVLGADVTHPGVGNSRSPSIAALVGSMDAHPSKYRAVVRVQKHRQEIIADLMHMTKDMLLAFYRMTRCKPKRILFYRDGVSEGQFQQCLGEELRAIRNACEALEHDYHPGITFVVVQKRHHTRIFCADPRDQVGRSGNIPPGTVVEDAITHPFEHDFFLCSHYGIQGTSRPTHYHVLWDDNMFSAERLQQLSYQLCHTYVRCTRSVSIPAPAYYAHLVAFRARYHIEQLDCTDEGDSSACLSDHEDHIVRPDLQSAVQLCGDFGTSMYFA